MRRAISIALMAALIAGAFALPASAKSANKGETTTLADHILADADGRFDRRWSDYDIISEIVRAILDSGISTQLGAAADPNVELTAFLPNDRAFRRLAHDLTGQWIRNEADIIPALLTAVSGDLALVNAIVEYHVVPGKITARTALRSDGAELTSIMGASFEVDVKNRRRAKVELIDNDPDLRNPRLIRWDLNNYATNGIWHGIDRVLIPIDV
jgi:uncharacterized surface protein with fasciclin (FAS1) repeats